MHITQTCQYFVFLELERFGGTVDKCAIFPQHRIMQDHIYLERMLEQWINFPQHRIMQDHNNLEQDVGTVDKFSTTSNNAGS
jgi:hypothetical protein